MLIYLIFSVFKEFIEMHSITNMNKNKKIRLPPIVSLELSQILFRENATPLM